MTARQRTPEHCRQAWLHRFLEAVVRPPCEIRGVDNAHAAQSRIGTRMMTIGRGVKAGTPDHWVFQGNPLVVVALEVKHETKPSPAQIGTADALERARVYVVRECRTIADALAGLRNAGVRLFGNADAAAVYYQAQMDGALREMALAAPKKAAAPRQKRDSAARTRKWAQIQRGMR